MVLSVLYAWEKCRNEFVEKIYFACLFKAKATSTLPGDVLKL